MDEYPLMVSPFPIIPFEDMSKKQTELYFQWFMSEKDKRIIQLQDYINKSSKKKVVLDKTPESLIDLWEWFENNIEFVNIPDEKWNRILCSKTQKAQDSIKNCKEEMSLLTKALAFDISIYYGDTMTYNNPNIHWGYKRKPKKLDGVNEPILLGYKLDMCVRPLTLVSVAVHKSHKVKNKKQLYDIYNVWLEDI